MLPWVRALCAAAALAVAVSGDRADDWLVTEVTDPAVVLQGRGDLVITNGLVTRRFATTPAFGTVDVRLNATTKYGGDQSFFRAVSPEAVVELNGTAYVIGGLQQKSGFRGYCNRTSLAFTAGPAGRTFTYVNHTVSAPVAPFAWKPGTRHSVKTAWPPKGVTLSVLFAPPPAAPEVHVTVHYQMLQGVPLMQKWVTVTAAGGAAVVTGAAVELLSVMPRFGRYTPQTPYPTLHFWPGKDEDGAVPAEQPLPLLYAKTDQAHGAACVFQSDWPNDHQVIPGCPTCKDEGASEPVLNCSYTSAPGALVSGRETFESFVVEAMVSDSEDLERHSLSRHRVTYTLAPHTTENPIFFHGTDSTPAGVKAALDQMVEVGFEMFIFSFGSGFNLESKDAAYLAELKDLVSYANAKGIEVGGYDLISLSRVVPAEWQAVGNEGSACMASGWYDHLLGAVDSFINATGLSMLETDGPYSGYTCSATNHAHHHNVGDSVYRQTQMQNEFYRKMRERNVYVNQPDAFFFQGGSRTGLGYDEQQFSLPRWEDLSVSRMWMYDDLYSMTPTQGWMFLPLSQYHAGGDAATFLGHDLEYEWGLAQYLGAGTAACYRGPKPYTTDSMKAILQKWIGLYKSHRETITKPVVHIRRADQQSWDGWLHVNPFSSSAEVGFAMFFNPTSAALNATISVDLYYTSLETDAMVSVDGEAAEQVPLRRDYTIVLRLPMAAKSIHYVTFSRPERGY